MAETITITPYRSVGGIVADATIEESHDDSLTVTEHPVENSAPITDHAYSNPAELRLQLGWSNSSAQAGGDDGFVRDIYRQLLALQASRRPLDIVTGKRSYRSMLIRSLGITTDQTTEAALMVSMTCRQVFLVETRTTTVPPDPKVHADPKATGPVNKTTNGNTKAVTLDQEKLGG